MKLPAVLGAAALMLVGCAADRPEMVAYADTAGANASANAAACFRMTDIRAHRIAGPDAIYIDVGGRETWRVAVSGACLAAASRQETLITENRSGSAMVCRPIDLDLKVKVAGMVSPCIVRDLTRLTPAEVAALPPELRP